MAQYTGIFAEPFSFLGLTFDMSFEFTDTHELTGECPHLSTPFFIGLQKLDKKSCC